MSISLLTGLVGAFGVGGPKASGARFAQSGVLQVETGQGWETWWRADSAPDTWPAPNPIITNATHWEGVAAGVDLGELIVSSGGWGLRTRLVLVRFDPGRTRMVLAGSGSGQSKSAGWTVDSADGAALVAFNAGQYGPQGPWGWVVRDAEEHQLPGWGPLSLAVAVAEEGSTYITPAESIAPLRARILVRDAFQSYPALLVDDGRVPAPLRDRGSLVDLGHRDTRLFLCMLGDGRLLVALTRFENLGRVFGSLPIGLTLDEAAAIAGGLGCRRAVSLDGGLSAQLLVRPDTGASRRWTGWRTVPLGIELLPRP